MDGTKLDYGTDDEIGEDVTVIPETQPYVRDGDKETEDETEENDEEESKISKKVIPFCL